MENEVCRIQRIRQFYGRSWFSLGRSHIFNTVVRLHELDFSPIYISTDIPPFSRRSFKPDDDTDKTLKLF